MRDVGGPGGRSNRGARRSSSESEESSEDTSDDGSGTFGDLIEDTQDDDDQTVNVGGGGYETPDERPTTPTSGGSSSGSSSGGSRDSGSDESSDDDATTFDDIAQQQQQGDDVTVGGRDYETPDERPTTPTSRTRRSSRDDGAGTFGEIVQRTGMDDGEGDTSVSLGGRQYGSPTQRPETPSEQRRRRESTLATIDPTQFDPTTESGIESVTLEGDRRQEAVGWATDELGLPEDEVEFARDQDGDLLAYRDPDAVESAYGDRLEQQIADQMGVDPERGVDYNADANRLELTQTGRSQVEREAQQDVAEDLDNFSMEDLESDIDQGGRVSVSVREDAVRRELVEQIQEQNPDVDRSQIEFAREDGQLTASVEVSQEDETADPVAVARDELSSLVGEASGPGDVADAAGNVGGAVVDEQLGEEFLVDPRETGSAGEYAADLTTAYDEEVLTVDSPEEATALVTDPIKIDSENFDDPAAAADDLAAHYQGETGISRESVTEASQTVLSPTTGTGSAGALGTAAVAGVATPEPTTTAGGLILGAGVLGASAIRQHRDRDQGEVPVSEPTQATSEVGVGETITGAEIPVTEGAQTSEVSVPETPPSRSQRGEIDAPSTPTTTRDPTVVQTAQQIADGVSEEQSQDEEADLLDEEQVTQRQRRERGETARQTYEQTIYEQEQRYGDIERQGIGDRAEQESVAIEEYTNPDITGEESARQQQAYERQMEDLTPWQRQMIRGRMGTDQRQREQAQEQQIQRQQYQPQEVPGSVFEGITGTGESASVESAGDEVSEFVRDATRDLAATGERTGQRDASQSRPRTQVEELLASASRDGFELTQPAAASQSQPFAETYTAQFTESTQASQSEVDALLEDTGAQFEYSTETRANRQKRRRFPSLVVDQQTDARPSSGVAEFDRLIENELASADEVLGQ